MFREGIYLSDISVSQDFSTFIINLKMKSSVINDVQTRYHTITKKINKNFLLFPLNGKNISVRD